MILLIDRGNSFNKIQLSYITKVLNYMDIEGENLSKIKAIYNKPTINVILSNEKLNNEKFT